ncbi:MAG: hypothetical protein KBT20_00290 [Bacteroidales bacterium]|nr:hypothetical protein [Candidatus Liminaster caballi]
MKKYIAPLVKVIDIETESLIAQSPTTPNVGFGSGSTDDSNQETGGYRSNLWGDDED